jgi:aldehyde dehydrogenase (NAD+)
LQRGRILYKVADLLEQNVDELAAIEALDNGKPFHVARNIDLQLAIKVCGAHAAQ